MIYFVFSTALLLIPHLMLEEKQTKTLDALLTSPASPGQVVLGKALAGFFYILVIGGLALALFSLYIVHWGLALAAFLGYALLAIGLGLAVGSFIKSAETIGALDGGADPLPGGPAALLHGTKPESRHPDGPDLVPIFGVGQPLPLLLLHGRYPGTVPAEPCGGRVEHWHCLWPGDLESAAVRPLDAACASSASGET